MRLLTSVIVDKVYFACPIVKLHIWTDIPGYFLLLCSYDEIIMSVRNKNARNPRGCYLVY